MEKIKDFIYEKSDLFFATLVVVVVVLVISNNLGAWMFVDAEGNKYEEIQSRIQEEDESSDSLSEQEEDPAPDSDSADDTEEAEGTQDQASNQKTEEPVATEEKPAAEERPAVEEKPAVNQEKSDTGKSRNVSVAPGSTAQSIADSLKAQGLIADTGEFLKSLAASGKDTKLKAGNFTFPEGVSSEQIIDILTK